jgi:hypothetical protein
VSLLPAESSFHERVQDCFAAYRGRGVMLSALDVELLDAWARTEVPFEVVARGMRQAAEAALYDAVEGERGLRSLSACRRKVEAEIKKYFGKSTKAKVEPTAQAPEIEEPLHLVRFKKQRALLKKLGKEHPALDATTFRLLERVPAPADYAASARQEELVFAALMRGLPFERRRALLREAGSLVQKAGSLTRGARREALRFHRAALLKRELGLAR